MYDTVRKVMSHDITKVAGKALCGVAVASFCTIS